MSGPNPAQGFVQMGGGYEEAVRQHQPQAQQQQQPFNPQAQLQQMQQQLPPQMQPRFGDPRPPSPAQQQAAANQYGQQYPFMNQQQQQLPPQGVDLNTRLQGANIPPDLQGRTVAEVIAINQGLRQVHMQALSQQQRYLQPPPPPQPQSQQQVQQPAQQQQQPGNQPGFDWRNPDKSIEAVVDRSMGKHMQQLQDSIAPALQGAAVSGIASAKAQAAAAVGPMFGQFEAQIMQSLQGADPRILQNPVAWQVAAERVIGQAALNGQRGQQQPQQQFQGQPQTQPVPNLSGFFTEQSNQGGPGSNGVQLSPQQRAAASAMNMSEANYAAWLGGAPGGLR